MYSTWEQKPASGMLPTFPIWESTDNGLSWEKVGDITDTQNGLGMSACPQLFEMHETIRSLAVGTMNCVENSQTTDMARTYLDMYKSTDCGRTWTFVSRISTTDPVWEPFLMVHNNKLICYYSDQRDPNHSQKLVHQTSTDGVIWSSIVDDVALSDTNLRPGMPTIAKASNYYDL